MAIQLAEQPDGVNQEAERINGYRKRWQKQHELPWAQRNASSDDSGGGVMTSDHAHVHTAWGAVGSSAQPGESGKRGAAFL